jgi:hypothetical protein
MAPRIGNCRCRHRPARHVLMIGAERTLACCSDTFWAWHRTWHAPNPLATPLRGYFVPRMPGRCDREAYAGGWDYAGGSVCGAPGLANGGCTGQDVRGLYPPEAGLGLEPATLERLGHIPNDFDLGAPLPTGAPGRGGGTPSR